MFTSYDGLIQYVNFHTFEGTSNIDPNVNRINQIMREEVKMHYFNLNLAKFIWANYINLTLKGNFIE